MRCLLRGVVNVDVIVSCDDYVVVAYVYVDVISDVDVVGSCRCSSCCCWVMGVIVVDVVADVVVVNVDVVCVCGSV